MQSLRRKAMLIMRDVQRSIILSLLLMLFGAAALHANETALEPYYGKVIRHAWSLDEKVVALSFDDGPRPDHTRQVLSTLKDEGIQATFFVLGTQARQYPEIVREIHDAGHEIGTHSWSHKRLSKVSAATMHEEINRPIALVEELIGERPQLFRPPYGATNAATRAYCKEEGQVIVNWCVDPEDWKKNANTESMLGFVKKQVQPGSIILIHDIYARSATAVGPIVDYLKAEGYRFVTVGELLEMKATQPADNASEDDGDGVTMPEYDREDRSLALPASESISIPLDDTE